MVQEKSQRKPRILWANLYCLLDTSSGASISIRQMLIQLAKQGFEIQILGATIFDSEKGATLVKSNWQHIKDPIFCVQDGILLHYMVRTENFIRSKMNAEEENIWFNTYRKKLDSFKPDLVWFYGGLPLDMLISYEARIRGIPSVAYLANGNYAGIRWCQDVDLILTDTKSTSEKYKKKYGIHPIPIGKFIDPQKVISPTKESSYLTFINPSLEKGAAIIVRLAMILEERRPDIQFEVVESRGNWQALVNALCKQMGKEETVLANVKITPNTKNMASVYSRSKLLLAPSLWWESGARVLAEALMNHIPVITTDYGGNAEMIQDAGIIIKFPRHFHQAPYHYIPSEEQLKPIIYYIEKFYDDNNFYQEYVDKAKKVSAKYDLNKSTKYLLNVLYPLLLKNAGNQDFNLKLKKRHKHV